MRIRFLLILLFPIYLSAQDSSICKLLINNASYSTIYGRSHKHKFNDSIYWAFKKEKQEIRLVTNKECDTLPIISIDPTKKDSFVVSCLYISVIDTTEKRDIPGLKNLLDNEIFIVFNSVKRAPDSIRVRLIDEMYNYIFFNNKSFDMIRVGDFLEKSTGNVYAVVEEVMFGDGPSPQTIYARIACRLEQ